MTPDASEPIDPRCLSLLWAGPERAGAIARLHGLLFDRAWDEASIADMLAGDDAIAFIAQIRNADGEDPTFGGFVIGRHSSGEAEILSLGVPVDLQRRGIATHLLDGLVRAGKRAGVGRLYLEVSADNNAAVALYLGKGFKAVGRRRRYYKQIEGPGTDALVLALQM